MGIDCPSILEEDVQDYCPCGASPVARKPTFVVSIQRMCLPEDRKVWTNVLMLVGSISQRVERGLVPAKGSVDQFLGANSQRHVLENAYTNRQIKRLIAKCTIRQVLLDQAYRCVKMEGRSESGRAPVAGMTWTPSRFSAIFQVTM